VPPRLSCFAATPAEVDAHVARARSLEGATLAGISYVAIDDDRGLVAPGLVGPRQVVDPAEWSPPHWAFAGFDAIDFGVELTLGDGRVVAVGWDPPGETEGLWVEPVRLVGPVVSATADVTVWDVTGHGGWASLAGQVLQRVALRHRPWPEGAGGFWCPEITLTIGDTDVRLVLGDVDLEGDLEDASYSVAVLWDPALALP
jgi:hypothetical protein